jgi:hypothetical protein
MKTTMAGLLALGMLLAGCSEEESRRSVELQVDGSVASAHLSWRDDRGSHQQLDVPLPWTHRYEAREGDAVFVAVSHADPNTQLWIRILEDGDEVHVVPGCLCNGSSVSASAQGVVGYWE